METMETKYKIIYAGGEETKEEKILDLLNSYPIVDGLGTCRYYKNGKEISLREFITDFYNEIEEQNGINLKRAFENLASSGGSAKVASSGNSAQLASSGDCAKVASSGNSAQLASSGDCAQLASSGDYARVASSGDCAKIASSGDYARVASSGGSAQLASSGDCAQLASSGDCAKVASSGDCAQLASSGDCAKIASSGDYARVASSGGSANLASSGDCAKVASSGNSAKHNIQGKNSVCFDCGIGGIVKGVKGTHIALCEWVFINKKWIIKGTKTAIIDGIKIKEDTYYGLYNGDFLEIDFTDDIKSAVIKKKGKVKLIKIININNNILSDKISYVVSDNNLFAHGETIQKARENLLYKISNRDTSMYKNYTLDTIVSFEEGIRAYRVITGACELGTKLFVKTHKIKNKKYTIKEIIEKTKGQFGNEKFSEFFRNKDR